MSDKEPDNEMSEKCQTSFSVCQLIVATFAKHLPAHRHHPELAHCFRESREQHQDGVAPSGEIYLRMDRFRPKYLVV
jgi:hypothetical protein